MTFDHELDNILNCIRQRGLVYPSVTHIQIDKPTSNTNWYYEDSGRFSELGPKRQMFVRPAVDREFELNAKAKFPLFPSLWILVQRMFGCHIRIPIWRGNQPFTREPSADDAIFAVMTDCLAKGGVDRDAFNTFFRHSQ